MVNSSLYRRIADEYADLFPSSPEKIAFAESLVSETPAVRILDIGCASGEFCVSLHKADRTIRGIDLDPAMIEAARRHAAESGAPEMTFTQSEMLEYLCSAKTDSMDVIFCMGNTAAYLTDRESILVFFENCLRLLCAGGTLVLQLLNYDNHVFAPGYVFPPLTGTSLHMYRSYLRAESSEHLEFHTKVTDSKGTTVIEDRHIHRRTGSDEVEALGREAGFEMVRIFGGYSRSKPSDGDFFRLFLLSSPR